MERKYKDHSNKIHQIDENFTHLLPTGCVEVSDVEANAILNPPKMPEQITVEDSAVAKAELVALDLKSIRPIREYLAAKPDAPKALKDHEAAAVLARTKVKP